VCEFGHGTPAHFVVLSIQIGQSRIAAVTEDNKYHRKALGCVQTAERLHDPGERAKLFEIARAYLGLARHVGERQDRNAEFDSRRIEEAAHDKTLAPPA
jgi:hypothetical protein